MKSESTHLTFFYILKRDLRQTEQLQFPKKLS